MFAGVFPPFFQFPCLCLNLVHCVNASSRSSFLVGPIISSPGSAAIDNKKRVYFAGPDMLSTAGGQRYQHFMIKAAGGINVAQSSKEGWSGITLEQLINWDPQVIIVADYCSSTPKSFLTDPRLKEIQAVKTDNVFKVPSFILSWDVPSPESLLGIMWLSNTLYPSTINFNLKKTIKKFYSSMYDYNPSNSELSTILD